MNECEVPKKFLNMHIDGNVGIKTEKNGKKKLCVEGNEFSRGSFQASCQTGHLRVCMFKDKEKKACKGKGST